MHAPGSRTSDYDYHLPEELIAQSPCEPRDASRLLVLDRASGDVLHRRFTDILEYLAAGDTLVVNATQVFRARLLATRQSGQPAEIFLLRPVSPDGTAVSATVVDQDALHWEAMVQPGAKLKPGRRVHVAPGFDVDILETTPQHTRIVQLIVDPAVHASVSAAIATCGHVPLPPYITRSDTPSDATRYQTVYARAAGSVAAPTAGLHFTPELLARVTEAGVDIAEVVLHVGAGTFRPVHTEWCEISPATAATIATTRARGGKVWAVGTTAVRTLESAVDADGVVQPGARDTELFIRPPQRLRAVDRMITNFHQPRSTLLMLVSAFASHDLIMRAYADAVAHRYRFLSYGDAMCIL
jgi:S-adenosylmethionine:tRNA ribosyltransferase-isomerase